MSLEEELQAKLDNALETVGLTDLATGEQIDLNNVTGDIQFPTTRDMHINSKYQPVTITSSNPNGYYENVVQYVREHIGAQGRLDPSKSTENSRLILSLTAAGYDVIDIGGYNLLTGLSDLNYVKKQGVNGPIYALIALDSNYYEIPAVTGGGVQTTRENLIRAILDSGILDDSSITGSREEALDTSIAMAARAIHRSL